MSDIFQPPRYPYPFGNPLNPNIRGRRGLLGRDINPMERWLRGNPPLQGSMANVQYPQRGFTSDYANLKSKEIDSDLEKAGKMFKALSLVGDAGLDDFTIEPSFKGEVPKVPTGRAPQGKQITQKAEHVITAKQFEEAEHKATLNYLQQALKGLLQAPGRFDPNKFFAGLL